MLLKKFIDTIREKEVENYLSERGVNWAEKGQNPIMVFNIIQFARSKVFTTIQLTFTDLWSF